VEWRTNGQEKDFQMACRLVEHLCRECGLRT
jgi:hypothetical protein